MHTKFDALIYAALAAVVLVMFVGAWVIIKTPDKADIETRKLRFAAATFTGITMLFVFVSILYVAGEPAGPGQQIFDKGFTAMFTLAGTILGYLFGSNRSNQPTPTQQSSDQAPQNRASSGE